ncbi:MAG: 50S ribosomal protein L28 [Patescibacteria group bacterium]
MSRKCDFCGRKARSGNSRSHSNTATKRKFMINLQTKTVDGRSRLLCTNCIKTAKKKAAKN